MSAQEHPDPQNPTALSLQSLSPELHSDQTRTVGHFAGLTVRSHFQPIFSVAHSRAVGYEGLMRATDTQANPVAPLDVFRMDRTASHTVAIDRLASAVHVHNFLRLQAQGHHCFDWQPDQWRDARVVR